MLPQRTGCMVQSIVKRASCAPSPPTAVRSQDFSCEGHRSVWGGAQHVQNMLRIFLIKKAVGYVEGEGLTVCGGALAACGSTPIWLRHEYSWDSTLRASVRERQLGLVCTVVYGSCRPKLRLSLVSPPRASSAATHNMSSSTAYSAVLLHWEMNNNRKWTTNDSNSVKRRIKSEELACVLA